MRKHIQLNGSLQYGSLLLTGVYSKVSENKIPDYFSIDIDINSIRKRNRLKGPKKKKRDPLDYIS